ASLRVRALAIWRKWSQACVARIIQPMVERRRAAVAEQARGEWVNPVWGQRFFHAEGSATGRGVSEIERHRASDRAAVDQHRRPIRYRWALVVVNRSHAVHFKVCLHAVELRIGHQSPRNLEWQRIVRRFDIYRSDVTVIRPGRGRDERAASHEETYT